MSCSCFLCSEFRGVWSVLMVFCVVCVVCFSDSC